MFEHITMMKKIVVLKNSTLINETNLLQQSIQAIMMLCQDKSSTNSEENVFPNIKL